MSEPKYTYVKGIYNPEDMAHVPGTHWLIAGGIAKKSFPGGLYLVDTRAKTREKVWPGRGERVRRNPRYGDCEAPVSPENFMTHGLNLLPQKDGVYTLYAVNRAERSSIEVFEVEHEGDNLAFYWTGAIVLPERERGNGVQSLPDGGLLVTMPFFPDDPDFVDKLRKGQQTGHVLRWHPDSGWSRWNTIVASGPNGIALSTDNTLVYVAYTGNKTFVSQKLDADEPEKIVDLGFAPDNIRIDETGMIWVGGIESIDHPVPRICRIDPVTLEPTHIPLPPPTEEFEGCSGAIRVGDEIWLGTHDGDRLAVIPVDGS